MTNIMLDLETLGTKPGCSILSIGAVEFDEKGTYREFYVEISRESNQTWRLTEDEDTLKWWMTQPEEARRILTSGQITIVNALFDFERFVYANGVNSIVWGNGATFDPPIIEAAFQKVLGRAPPWKFYNVRCFRTLKNLFKDVQSPVETAAHNALMDAKAQAQHAVAIAQKHGLAFA